MFEFGLLSNEFLKIKKRKLPFLRKTAIQHKFFCCILQYNFEAIHNKDYSVVKTFKPPRLSIRGFFIFLNHEQIKTVS